MTPARHRLDRYDEHGQDTWVAPDEDRFAAEMGQPSTAPPPHHAVRKVVEYFDADDRRIGGEHVRLDHFPAVLAQTPVQCHECRRLTVEGVDTIVLVDGKWFHEGCVGEES